MTATKCEKNGKDVGELSTNNNNADAGHLLYRLKVAVERVLLTNSSGGIGANVWLGYAGLVDLVADCIGDVFRHGLKSKIRNDEPIVEWLNNDLNTPAGGVEEDPNKESIPIIVENLHVWIRDHLLEYRLTDQLTRLLHNRTVLSELYSLDAFLRLPPYVESLFACLRSLEEQKHKFLTEIDPALYLHSIDGLSSALTDARSLSFPVLNTTVHKFTSMECCSDVSSSDLTNTANAQHSSITCASLDCARCIADLLDSLVSTVASHVRDQIHRESFCSSTSSIASSSFATKPKSSTIDQQSSANLSSSTTNHRRTRSDDVFLRRLAPMNAAAAARSTSPGRSIGGETAASGSQTWMTSSRSSTSSKRNSNQMKRYESAQLIKESWMEATRLSDFIAQREYETSLELERENAHFLLSEMLIGAIEQMKWRNVLSTQLPSSMTHIPASHSTSSTASRSQQRPIDDEEERFSNSHEGPPSAAMTGFSDSSGENFYLSSSSGGGCDLTNSWSQGNSYEGTQLRNDIRETFGEDETAAGRPGTSRMAQQSSRSLLLPDLQQQQQQQHSSAEAVAMNLLQKFSQKHFSPDGAANDLKFLVSYKDVPQLLLPMPQSLPVAPDEVYAEGFKQKVKLRGTFEWAPPRPQLIFKLHPVPKLKPLLEQQAFKCAGCGMKLDKAYFKRLRYCAYLGRLFCQCCHQGQTATIPSHVIHKWDFRKLPVSDFSYRFLTQQSSAPVWNIRAIDDADHLYASVKSLRAVRDSRQQLKYCWDYVRTCRLAKELITTNGRLTDLFESLPTHLIQDTEVYSMQDFTEVKDGSLYSKLESILLLARYHIESCQYCRAKGFVCEICRKDEILFPFHAAKRVKRCPVCGSCFHSKCLRKRECPKCVRMQSRRDLATQNILEQDDEYEEHEDA